MISSLEHIAVQNVALGHINRVQRSPLAVLVNGQKLIGVSNSAKSLGSTCGNLGCKSPGKHPSVIGGFKEATTDLDKINNWWGYAGKHRDHNIGIVPGLSGLVVIDIDPKNAGDRGLDKLIDKYGQMGFDTAPRVCTGSGGNHFYFQADPNDPLSNARGALPGGIDVRGCSGYVVAPPSLHISGKPYVWENITDVPELMAKVKPLDPTFLKLIKEQRFLPSYRQNVSYGAAKAPSLESKKLAIKNWLIRYRLRCLLGTVRWIRKSVETIY